MIACRNEGIRIQKNEKSTLEFKFEELISHSKTLGIFVDYVPSIRRKNGRKPLKGTGQGMKRGGSEPVILPLQHQYCPVFEGRKGDGEVTISLMEVERLG